MANRRYIPLAIMAILTVLTAGFAVLAVSMAPTAGDRTVQDSTAATLGAQSFTLDLTISVSAGPGTGVLSQVRRVTYTSPDHMVVRAIAPTKSLLGTLNAAATQSALDNYAALTAGATPWVLDGTNYKRTESLVVFYARQHRTSAAGQVAETAVIRNGYLIYVKLRVIVPNQTTAGGQQAPGGVAGETYHVVTIDGAATPAVPGVPAS
jgi:hypothetical protein